MRLRNNPLVFAGLLAMPLVLAASRSAFAIIGGELDGDDHPCVGTMIYINPPADRPNLETPRVLFTGTLIHPRVLLTTGYRTNQLQQQLADGLLTLDDVRVSFGSYAYEPDTWLKVCDVFTHPDFDPNQANGLGAIPMPDLGVLILCDPVTDIEPAAIAPAFFLDFLDDNGLLQAHPDGTPFLLVGYGNTEVHGSPERDGLRRAVWSEFFNLYDEWLHLSQNFSQDEGGTGYSDAGGPVLWVDPDTGDELLVAVTSRGDLQLVSNSLNYRLDIPEARWFLEVVIEYGECED